MVEGSGRHPRRSTPPESPPWPGPPPPGQFCRRRTRRRSRRGHGTGRDGTPEAGAENRGDRAAGVLLGLAAGDALGRPVEFRSAARIAREHGRVTEMLADRTHGKPAGTVTDDTELALCIARSLVECGGFDPGDVADRFVAWLDAGPFDVGLMTRDAITELRNGTPPADAGQQVWEHRLEGSNAGNGSVMWCAPHALASGDDPARLVAVSRDSSALTHADPRCTWGCAALNLVLAGLVDGAVPAAVLDDARERTTGAPDELRTRLDGLLSRDPDGLSGSGYVLDTLESGLHWD